MKLKKCSICGKECNPTNYRELAVASIGTGYARDKNNNPVCYTCCANQDYKDMLNSGTRFLYLIEDKTALEIGREKYELTNWPGTLRFNVISWATGRHNIAGKRMDVWFKIPFDAFIWHGVCYGDNTQITHCKRTKKTEV